MGNTGSDERGRRKREREYLAGNPVKACRICHRWFTKHARGDVCSVDCLRKMEGQASSSQ